MTRATFPMMIFAVFVTAFVAFFASSARAASPCSDTLLCLDQNWTQTDRAFWYRASQGSRLIPLAWMRALEEADSEEALLSPDNLTRYGYLQDKASSYNPYGLPVGFVIDHDRSRSADIMCQTLPAICAGRVMRQEWLGLNCSACHTADIRFEGKTVRVEGAPALADFQTMLEDLHAALLATSIDERKLERFATRVLGANHAGQARKALQAQIAELAAYRGKLLAMNRSDVRYGYGRLDAQGHILNKVALVGQGGDLHQAVRSNAPASYPHVWNTSQQDKIQWNGIAGEIVKLPIFGKTTDIGGLVRNVSEVIGVFAHMEVSPRWKPAFLGYESSVRVKEMIDLEQTLEKLGSPAWPEEVFGPIDADKATRGRTHFVDKCAQCHDDLAVGDITSPIKVKMSGVQEVGTDVMLACNTLLHRSNAGLYEGRKFFIVKGERIKSQDSTTLMLKNAAAGVVVGKLDELLESVVGDVLDGVRTARFEAALSDDAEYLPGALSPEKRALAEQCLKSREAAAENTIVAYKARPLNGIWATAPYLHNGSVPSLYDLLLPSHLRTVLKPGETMAAPGPEQRALSFHVGSREFDPVHVGFRTDNAPVAVLSDGTPVPPFRFDVVDGEGNPVPGNYNSGHEYGTADLSENERLDLLEYLKTL